MINGVDVGTILRSRYIATSIIDYVGNEIRNQVLSHILATSAKVAVLIYETATESKTSAMTWHTKAELENGEPILFFFLDQVELPNQSAEGVTNALSLSTLSRIHRTVSRIKLDRRF